LGVLTTIAIEHHSRGLGELIDKVSKQYREEVMAYKGYKCKANDELQMSKSHIK